MPAADDETRYQRRLLALLLPASFFNGFDSELRVVLLPQLRSTFHVGIAAVGLANIPIGASAFIAFALIRRADRIGRRPLLLVTLVGYAVFTALTATSWDLASFAVFQTGSQILLGTEYALAVIVVAEEFPPERRGRAIGLLMFAFPLGVVGTAALLGAGLLHTPLGWRSFYLVGIVPVLLISYGRRSLRETQAYERIAGEANTRRLRELLAQPWRRKIETLGALSFCVKVPATAAAGWWVYYAEHERHFSTHLVALDLGTAFALGTSGYYLCGWAMDRLGRRPVAAVYLVAACASGVALFQSSGKIANFVLLFVAVFFGLGVGPVLSALSAESFPTEIRAGASSVVGNGFAATGELVGPALVGVLGASNGLIGNVGDSVCALAALMVVALAIVIFGVEETRGRSLLTEEILTAPYRTAPQ